MTIDSLAFKDPQKMPVTVISGFLGAGKTTLLREMLNNRQGLRVAVIVNDMSEINIDASLIQKGENSLSRIDEELVEMTNGCICCTLRDDLLREVARLAEQRRFEYLLIESTGIGEPLPIAATFSYRDDSGKSLSDMVRLDTMVTVVDAANLLRDYASDEFLKDRGQANNEGDNRSVVGLLVDQIEFSDVIVLNKISEIPPDQLSIVRALLYSLNMDARIIETNYCKVATSDLMNTGLYDEQRSSKNLKWEQGVYNFSAHRPEVDEYGIESFVFRSRMPFIPDRFFKFIRSRWPGVIRAKGYFWLATRPDQIGSISLAGYICRTEFAGHWHPSILHKASPSGLEGQHGEGRDVELSWGDRRQELVFIGIGMDRTAIIEALHFCLFEIELENIDKLRRIVLPDPFERWEQ